MDENVAKRILELTDSGLQGLEYVHEQNMEGRLEQTASVFAHVVQAFSEIEQSLVGSKVMCKELEEASNSLRDGLDWMTKAYEKQENIRPVEVMQLTLLPRYGAWMEELAKCLSQYVDKQ